MHKRLLMKALSIVFTILLLSSTVFSFRRNRIAFFHVSDIHGYLEPRAKDGYAAIGGVTYLKDYMELHRKLLRDRGLDVIVFNSGDLFQKSAYGIIFKGKATISVMNLLPFDCIVPGNHELDNDVNFFTELPNALDARVICANARLNHRSRPRILNPYLKQKRNNVRMFTIGLLTEMADSMKSPRIGDQIIVTDIDTELARIFYKESISQSDIVILVNHCEFKTNEALAEKYPDRIDLIFGGHDHEVIQKTVQGIPIIHSGEYGLGFSIIETEFTGGKLYHYNWKYVPVGNRQVARELMKWKIELEKQTEAIIASGQKEISAANNKTGINELSYHVADIIRKKSNSEIGMINAGGVREKIPSGDIRVKHVIKIFPYDNYIVKLNINGKLLKKLIRKSFANSGKNSFLHFAGIRIVTDPGRKTLKIYRNGKIIKDEDQVSVSTSDFLTSGGDDFGFLQDFDVERFVLIRDAIVESVKKDYPFSEMPEWLDDSGK